jgi:hypothetical protein
MEERRAMSIKYTPSPVPKKKVVDARSKLSALDSALQARLAFLKK